MDNLLKIVKESSITFSGSLFGMVLNYSLLIIITRFLSPDEFGAFTLAESIVNVSLIFVLFGVPKALDRFIPYYNALGEHGKTKTLIFGVLKVTLIIGLLISFLLYLGSAIVSSFFSKVNLLPSVLKIMVLSIPMLAFIQVCSYTFIGFKELRYKVYIQQIILPLSKVICALALLFLGFGLSAWVWLYIFSLLFSSFYGYILLKTYIFRNFLNVYKKSISIKALLKYLWPLTINNVIIVFLGQINLFFLGFYSTPEEIGIYKIYTYLLVFQSLILTSLAQIYKPIVSSLIPENLINEINEIYKRISQWIFQINALSLLIILLFGPNIVIVLFTKNYSIAPYALYILSAGYFLNSAVGPEGMTLEAFGNTKLLMLNALIMLFISLTVNLILTPKYGITGSAVANALSITIGGLAGLIEIYLLYKFHPYTTNHIKYILVAFISGLFILMIKQLFPNSTFISILFQLILLIIVYTLGLYYLNCWDSTDYDAFIRIKNKIAGYKIRA